MLDFGEAVRRFYGNYANADGRAQRSAYWWVLLYELIIYAVLIIVLLMADGSEQIIEIVNEIIAGNSDPALTDDLQLGASGAFAIILMALFAIVNFIPSIMLQIRRFHDLGQSGWFVLLFFALGAIGPIAPLANIIHLAWFAAPGTKGENKYGPDPLAHSPDIFG